MPPVRSTGSPGPCANFSTDANVSVEPDTETIVAVSWFVVFPRRMVSPVAKPPVLTAVTLEAPTALTPPVLVRSAPGETASTATTVQ